MTRKKTGASLLFYLICLLTVLVLINILPLYRSIAAGREMRGQDSYYLPAAPVSSGENQGSGARLPGWTKDLKDARRAYSLGKFAVALKLFEKESQAGSVVADWYLGSMYRTGKGVPRDHAKAYSYYTKVADVYDPEECDRDRLRITVDAIVWVADYQRQGSPKAGISKNYKAAMSAYLKVATVYGHPAAMYGLGLMNIEGQGTKRNPTQGLKWLMASARKHHPQAQAYLGELYWRGTIISHDRARAIMWYGLAEKASRSDDYQQIHDRYMQLLSLATEEERLEAAAHAQVWSEEYPIPKN